MSPLTNSQNVIAGQNQQPEYSVLWHPYGIDPSVSAIWPIGSLLSFTTAGVGTNPGPGGDASATLTSPYTVPIVGLSSTTSTLNPQVVGVLLGVQTLGAVAQQAPNTIAGQAGIPSMIAMAGINGVMQVLMDSAVSPTVIGHTVNISTTTAGAASDSGGTTTTVGTTIGTVEQAVTISSGTKLVWCRVRYL